MDHGPYYLIDPVLIHIGPLAVRWYGIMYLCGFLCGYWVIKSELRRRNGPIDASEAGDFLFYLIVGLLIGARLGYVLFYNLPRYVEAPWEIFAIWHGGMSFHGGLLGMIVSGGWYARRKKASFLELADIGALAAPIGLMLGRIGNFINGELYGRVTTLPWALIFPGGGNMPRHPSQLYEAILEGPVLFGLLWQLRKRTSVNGVLLGVFLIVYGVSRFCIEFVREPDPQLGFVLWTFTMGQILCACMVVAGVGLLVHLRHTRRSHKRER